MSGNFSWNFKAALATGVALAALSSAAAAKSQSPKKVSPETILYYFQGAADGGKPDSTLVADQSGNFYGTTQYGGNVSCTTPLKVPRKAPPAGCGTVFKISANGTETVLHAFGSAAGDGVWPIGYLSSDTSGNLYGMTNFGGNYGLGSIYKVTPDGTETIVYSSNGSLIPSSNLLVDSQGNLYGASSGHGTGTGCGATGCGYIFELAPNGTLAVLYSFNGSNGDGGNPGGALVVDASGNIYGTTATGGAGGWGTVFKLAPGGTESVLYAFGAPPDAAQPQSGVTMDAQGNLYGTSDTGGGSGYGAVFKVTPDGTETVLLDCQNRIDGFLPYGTPVLDASGNLFDTTYEGGTYNDGTIFKLAPDGTETVLFNLKKKYGDLPTAGVILDQSGNIYGATAYGGNQSGKGNGVAFKLTQ